MCEWLSILAEGHFEAIIPSLSLSGQNERFHAGSGQVVWNSSEGLRLRAVTSGDAWEILSGTHYPIGELLPPHACVELEGTTQDQYNLLCNTIYEEPTHTDLAADSQKWDLPLWWVHLYREAAANAATGLFAILRPSQTLKFSRMSQTSDDNPMFGRSFKGMDWIELSTTYAKFTLRKDKDRMLRVCVEAAMTLGELENALESLRLAVSFIEGRALDIVGLAATCGGFLHRKLFGRRRNPDGILALPVPSLMAAPGMHDILLQHAAEFFHTSLGRQYSDSLRMCWDCSDNYASIKAITTCAALENMLRLTIEQEAGSKVGKSDQKGPDEEKGHLEQLANCLKKCQVGERLVKRVMGVLKSSHHLQPKHVLYDWVDRGVLGVEKEDIKAWDDLRNSVAHGHLAFNDADLANRSINFKYQKRVENMINKIILYAMNYKNGYFDYARACSISMSKHKGSR
jgi:hypothetical protein